MSGATHTAGPWRVAAASLYIDGNINVDAGSRGFICVAGKRGDEEAEANARLIAAAPELLEALRDMRTRFANCAKHNGSDEWAVTGACAKADAIIARAVHAAHEAQETHGDGVVELLDAVHSYLDSHRFEDAALRKFPSWDRLVKVYEKVKAAQP